MTLLFTSRFITCKTVFMLFITFIATFSSYAQYNTPENKIWVFGNKAGLDFNTGNPVPISSSINAGNAGGTLEANASVCDTAGVLLFYTDGSFVWDKSGSIMPDGNDL